MPSIFGIEAELRRIAEAFDALEGQDETPEVLAAVEAYFGELLENRDRKVDGYCRLIAEYSATAKARRAEADRVAALAKADELAAERLKARLKSFMEEHGLTRLEGAFHRVALQANGGKAPLVVNPELLRNPGTAPEWMTRTTVSIDNDAIRARIESGGEVPMDLAFVGDRGTHVRIR